MQKPIQAVRRLAAAAGACAAVLSGCERTAQTPTEPAVTVPAPTVEEPKPLAVPPVSLGRAELLAALDAAASAHAAGVPNTGQQPGDGLAGRRFTLRQPFGCVSAPPPIASPQPATPNRRTPELGLPFAAWGAGGKTIDLSLTPADWTTAPVMAGASGHWEAVEGVWLARSWLRDEACPASAQGAAELGANPEAPTPADRQTAGLAVVFNHGGSRMRRRAGKAFTATIRDEQAQVAAGGYRLVLEGRFAAFPTGGVIACHAESPDTRPVCVAAVVLDRIAFEQPDGKTITEWRPG